MTAILTAKQTKDLIDDNCPERIKKNFHVMEHNGDLMCCTLNQTNIQDNSNKFYIMQLLKNDKSGGYSMFCRGGRVGYVGSSYCDLYIYLDDALSDFNKRFEDKTGNTWENRFKSNIHDTKENKYEFIQMKHHEVLSEEELKKRKAELELKHKDQIGANIDDGVKNLVSLIYDPKLYAETLNQLKIDQNRLPLGKLSSKQMDIAYEIISHISQNIQNMDQKALLKYSSQFYSIIPYASGMSAPPIIDNEAKIKEKMEQLKALDEMIVAAEKMSNPKISSIEQRYLSLQCGLATVTDQKEIDMILNYAKNTSACTHNFKIKVTNIYAVDRNGENNRFNEKMANGFTPSQMHNRQLLWHGSRLANFVGILSKGLRINPQNVIHTGSMFGNGVYFSNTASKSAQYIHTKKNGIMMLCEVALGNCYELTNSKYIKTLPSGYDSTHGMGNTSPDPKGSITLSDGCIVPCGNLVKKNISSSLLYDEFIIYDISQVRIRYLVQMDLL